VGARRHIVHQTAGDRLAAFGLVDHLLAQGLPDALHRAAIELAAHDHRIHDAADVIDAAIADDLHFPGGRVDLDFAHVAAIGPARAGHAAGVLQEDALLRLLRSHVEQT